MEMMNFRTPNNNLLTLRFNGQVLGYTNIPIFELGETLTSIQRIIYKTYAYSQNLTSINNLTDEDKRILSLQIVGQRKGSDIYDLSSFVSNNYVILSSVIINALYALSFYTNKIIVDNDDSNLFDHYDLNMTNDPYNQEMSKRLRHALTTYFNESELRDLFFDLNIDYESLNGQNKRDKARELIMYMMRQRNLDILVGFCLDLRGDVIPEDYFTLDPSYMRNGVSLPHRTLASQLYSETINIARRVEDVKGIESVELITGSEKQDPIVFNKDTKKYINEIKNSEVLGDYQTIDGKVVKFNVDVKTIDFVTDNSRKIIVHLNQEDFNKLRYNRDDNALIAITGQPIFYLKDDNTKFSAFQGNTTTIIPSKIIG